MAAQHVQTLHYLGGKFCPLLASWKTVVPGQIGDSTQAETESKLILIHYNVCVTFHYTVNTKKQHVE
jgi:hypothetical protein